MPYKVKLRCKYDGSRSNYVGWYVDIVESEKIFNAYIVDDGDAIVVLEDEGPTYLNPKEYEIVDKLYREV